MGILDMVVWVSVYEKGRIRKGPGEKRKKKKVSVWNTLAMRAEGSCWEEGNQQEYREMGRDDGQVSTRAKYENVSMKFLLYANLN